MVAHIKTLAFLGVDAVAVDVQVHLAPGHNAFTVVGLPDKSVAESRERVRAELSAMGLALPYERITINLSPADLPKEGSHYDLPIAPDADGQSLLDRIADTKKLSARGFNRILRVARTLAGLDHSDMPGAENIATAIRWRDVTI